MGNFMVSLIKLTWVEWFIGSKVQCLFRFETCTTEVRGGEKGGSANFKTKHTEPLTQEKPPPLYMLEELSLQEWKYLLIHVMWETHMKKSTKNLTSSREERNEGRTESIIYHRPILRFCEIMNRKVPLIQRTMGFSVLPLNSHRRKECSEEWHCPMFWKCSFYGLLVWETSTRMTVTWNILGLESCPVLINETDRIIMIKWIKLIRTWEDRGCPFMIEERRS